MSEHETKNLSKLDSELLTRVDEVLHYLWDPIGVSDVPEARNEYSSYAGVVLSLLKRGAAESEIADYLRKIRVEHMGMGTLEDERSNEAELVELLVHWSKIIVEKERLQ